MVDPGWWNPGTASPTYKDPSLVRYTNLFRASSTPSANWVMQVPSLRSEGGRSLVRRPRQNFGLYIVNATPVAAYTRTAAYKRKRPTPRATASVPKATVLAIMKWVSGSHFMAPSISTSTPCSPTVFNRWIHSWRCYVRRICASKARAENHTYKGRTVNQTIRARAFRCLWTPRNPYRRQQPLPLSYPLTTTHGGRVSARPKIILIRCRYVGVKRNT